MAKLNHSAFRACVAVAIAAPVFGVALLSCVVQAQGDPLDGSWNLNVSKSVYSPGPPPKSQTLVVSTSGQGKKVAAEIVNAQGGTLSVHWTASFDGKDHPVIGSPVFDAVSLKRIDASTIEQSFKRAGKTMTISTFQVAMDGAVMTNTIKGTDIKGEVLQVLAVYDKQ
jgi:hypothetical protein